MEFMLDKKIKDLKLNIKFIDSLTENILILDMSGKIIYGNKSAVEMYGYSYIELTKLSIHNLLDKNSEVNDLLINEKSISTTHYKKDGTKFYAEIKPFYTDKTSNIIIVNISSGAYCLFELLKDNNIISKALEVSDNAFVVLTMDLNIYLWSKSAEKKFGYLKDDIFGKNIRVLIPDDRINEFDFKVETIKQNKSIEGFETKRKDKNGNLIDVSVTMAPLYDCRGKFNGVLGIYKDISEKIKLEEQLNESEERLRLALEGGRFGVWDWNIASNELFCSFLFNYLLGYTDNEIIKSQEELISKIHPVDREYVIDRINRHFQGEVFDIEFRMKCKDNNYKWVRSRAKVNEWTADGKPLRMVGIHEDITDKKAIEEEFNKKCKQLEKLKEEAESSSKAKSQFLANMSHEIRTPMNGIFGMVQLIKSTALSREQTKYIDLINESLSDLKEIIDDILDISKIESGKVTIKEESFDLRKAVNNIYSNLLVTGNSKNLEISYYLDPNINFQVISDELKIMQILNNLISNAVKFTRQGFISFRTKIIADYGDVVKIEFRIKDTGIGIEDGIKDKLFQDFSQGNISANKEFNGTGLGLAISKQLADILNGEISFESKANEGSTFIFTSKFKKDISITEDLQYVTSNKRDSEITNQNQEFTILSVEDNIINQDVIENFVTRKGYKFLAAYNGREALNILHDNKVDLILMDIQLPELNGFQITELIRKEIDVECNIPIIAVTAYAMHDDREKCIEAGMDDYISKPFNIEEFYEIIETYLNKTHNQ